MNKPVGLLFACLVLAAVAKAQSAGSGSPQTSAPEKHPLTLHVSSELVTVDVVAQDKNGQPARGLAVRDFTALEDGVPQRIVDFDEHSSETPVTPGPQLPPQPPGVFTDYNPVRPSGVLNVLLLDALNTPTKDQAYVQLELKNYVKKARRGTEIAIFGLTNHLYFLQGFASNPAVLKDAVEHKLTARASSLLDDPTGSNSDNISNAEDAAYAGMAPSGILSNLQSFDAEQDAFKTRVRMAYTLDAFNTLGHYLAALPGRKNLIWFSGSFPLIATPDLSLSNPFMVMGGDMEEKYRETINLLTRAQVAVYPIDPSGLMMELGMDAARSGDGYSKHPQSFVKDMSSFAEKQAQTHQTMLTIAEATGGEAIFNTNDLAGAVKDAVRDGSNFYILAYSPSNRNEDGKYRNIRVRLNNPAMAKQIKLSYRRGYFAEVSGEARNLTSMATTTDNQGASGAAGLPVFSYSAAAMTRGAPMPSDLLFRVRVLPASTSTEDRLAPDNEPDPKAAFKGPYRLFDIDISALPAYFTFAQEPNGQRTDKLQFLTYVYDPYGQLLNVVGRTVSLDLSPSQYKHFMASKIGFHLEVDAPAKGESYLRIGVHDVPANKFGVVEVPTSAVIHLPPPVYPASRTKTR